MAALSWDYDCAIIGAGPGGLVSGIYMRRFRRTTLVISGGKPRAAWIPKTHNLIGFPRGISGIHLLRRLNRHLDQLGAERCHGEAHLTRYRGGFEIRLDDDDSGLGRGGRRGCRVRARKVILATGMEDVEPPIPNLIELRHKGLLRYCPVCDAYEFREKNLAVLVQDDAGVQRALFLARYTRNLRILRITPPGQLEPFKLAPQRIREIRECGARVYQGELQAIERSQARPRSGLFISLKGIRPIYCDACYIELGCRVRDSAFRNLQGLHRTKEGFIIATTEQRTSIPGLFAVGDCVNLLGQISVAAGQAAVAATTIHNDLS